MTDRELIHELAMLLSMRVAHDAGAVVMNERSAELWHERAATIIAKTVPYLSPHTVVTNLQ